ncbi:MAG TPA: lipopolysaccharide heptosyltransferase II [Verrucomicrobiae bacterium]|nr:lipopolysaccharide heptosyltransferase II [Verrucomicrobiae bacterium]
MKILILKPSSLGDVLQALPVLRLLRLHFRDAQIYWWIDGNLAPLLENDPDLDGLIRFERKRWARPAHWPEAIQSIRYTRRLQFDLVIDLQCLLRSGIFAWLANGRCLVGLDDAREGARGFYDIIVPRASFHAHAADWYLSVLPRLGVPVHKNFNWLPEQPPIAAAIQAKWKPGDASWIAIQPGARWNNKRWPVAHFAELIRLLSAESPDARFVILGGRDDQPLGDTIARANAAACLNLCGETSLPEMIEWLRLCRWMITNDTGPMHAAAALGKPVVALFGPTEPRRTGPYGQVDQVLRIDLPCSPCLKSYCTWTHPMECLTAISPMTVLKHIRQRGLLEL